MFRSLAARQRRAILELLRERGALEAGEIAGCFEVSRPAISRDLRQLREAGLVRVEARGRRRIYHLQPARLRLLRDEWLAHFERFWDDRMSALSRVAESLGEESS